MAYFCSILFANLALGCVFLASIGWTIMFHWSEHGAEREPKGCHVVVWFTHIGRIVDNTKQRRSCISQQFDNLGKKGHKFWITVDVQLRGNHATYVSYVHPSWWNASLQNIGTRLINVIHLFAFQAMHLIIIVLELTISGYRMNHSLRPVTPKEDNLILPECR